MSRDEALSKVGKGIWSALTIIGAIAAAGLTLMSQDHKWAVAAAQEVVAPLEKKVDDHLSKDEVKAAQSDRERHRIFLILNALCKANPRAECPQGE